MSARIDEETALLLSLSGGLADSPYTVVVTTTKCYPVDERENK